MVGGGWKCVMIVDNGRKPLVSGAKSSDPFCGLFKEAFSVLTLYSIR